MRFAINTTTGRDLRVYAPTLRQAILQARTEGFEPTRPLSAHKALPLEDEKMSLQEGPDWHEKKKMGGKR